VTRGAGLGRSKTLANGETLVKPLRLCLAHWTRPAPLLLLRLCLLQLQLLLLDNNLLLVLVLVALLLLLHR